MLAVLLPVGACGSLAALHWPVVQAQCGQRARPVLALATRTARVPPTSLKEWGALATVHAGPHHCGGLAAVGCPVAHLWRVALPGLAVRVPGPSGPCGVTRAPNMGLQPTKSKQTNGH